MIMSVHRFFSWIKTGLVFFEQRLKPIYLYVFQCIEPWIKMSKSMNKNYEGCHLSRLEIKRVENKRA